MMKSFSLQRLGQTFEEKDLAETGAVPEVVKRGPKTLKELKSTLKGPWPRMTTSGTTPVFVKSFSSKCLIQSICDN